MKNKNEINYYQGVLPNTVLNHLSRKMNVLIVDDHPFIIEVVITALKKVEEKQNNYRFAKIDSATTLEEAYRKIAHSSNVNGARYDLIMLDIQLPEYREMEMSSGEDLGAWIKETLDTKPAIIVTTTYNSGNRLMSILKSIDPEGLIVKSDINGKSFVEAIKKSIEIPPFYSHTVTKKMGLRLKSNVELDFSERQMLYHISNGANTAELMELMHKSRRTIERKKQKVMDLLGIMDGSTMKLIAAAKSMGYL